MKPLTFGGYTQDGRQLVRGTFQMMDTHGFPLAMSIDEAERRGLRVDFFDFVVQAREASWSEEKIVATVQEAVADSGWDVPRTLLEQLLEKVRAVAKSSLRPANA